MQIDISDGVAELSRQGIADAKRACILGFDYGGYAALAGVTVQQGLYRCAEAIGGVTALSDMLTWGAGRYGRFDASMRILERRLGANSVADTAIDTRSPASLAAKADAPILLIYGIEDTVVPVSQSETMAKALQAAGKPVKLVVLPQEDHGLTREATRLQALQESIAFVEKYNPPG
jgi:dipeptidyl aminopeptidase/acylaminoacyl peptidase